MKKEEDSLISAIIFQMVIYVIRIKFEVLYNFKEMFTLRLELLKTIHIEQIKECNYTAFLV